MRRFLNIATLACRLLVMLMIPLIVYSFFWEDGLIIKVSDRRTLFVTVDRGTFVLQFWPNILQDNLQQIAWFHRPVEEIGHLFWYPSFYFQGYMFVLPLWVVIVLLSILPLRHVMRKRRIASRKRRGLCLACGYDLRGITNACPECGAAIKTR